MTVVQPPSYLQYGAYSAKSDRLALASLLGPGATPMLTRGGVRPSGDNSSLQVLPQTTPGASVRVSSGTVFIPESAGSGVYICHNDAPLTLPVNPASSSQNRRDLVVMQVYDQEVTGASNSAALQVVTGASSSGTATPPAVPSNSYALAEINVPAGTSTVISASSLTDRRAVCVAIGGTMPCLSTAMPANPYNGMEVYCTDVDELRVWSAASATWRRQSLYPLPAPVGAYAPDTTQAITATSFARLPTRHYINFTAAKPMYVMLHLAAWINTQPGSDVRATIGLTGATTGAGPNGALVAASGGANWGDVLYGMVGQYQQCSITLPHLLNAGTTAIDVLAYRNTTAGVPYVNYAVLRVTPLRYA